MISRAERRRQSTDEMEIVDKRLQGARSKEQRSRGDRPKQSQTATSKEDEEASWAWEMDIFASGDLGP